MINFIEYKEIEEVTLDRVKQVLVIKLKNEGMYYTNSIDTFELEGIVGEFHKEDETRRSIINYL